VISLTIYVVLPGDSLYTIARRFGVNPDEIYSANQLGDLPYLVVGQALVIPTMESTYTVRPGDSIWSIGRKFGVTPDSIISLNGISNPQQLTPGTVLRIPQKSKNYGYIEVNGYLEPSTPQKDTSVADEVGKYLTYIAPFSYRASQDGSLAPPADEPVLSETKKFRIAPLMVITNFANGTFSTEVADTILESDTVQNTLINNIISVLNAKGYYGVNIDFERISPRNRYNYNNFLRKVVAALHPLHYVVSTALAPKTSDALTGAWYGAHDYRAHGEIVDFVVIMTYEWGWSGGPAYAVAPVDLVEDVIRYAVSVIPSRKILMGMPLYGYDWTLPFKQGTFAKRVSPQDALRIAAEHGAHIQFNEQTQSPTFRYFDQSNAEHEVWFEDARSVQAKLLLVNKYDLRGVSYWLLGIPFPQNWLVLDSMYNIVKLVP
jgi:spore germination protein